MEFEPETIAAAGVHAHAPREPLLVEEDETISYVMARLALEHDWWLQLFPTPLLDEPPLALLDVRDWTVRDLGVMYGSLLRSVLACARDRRA